MSADMPSSLSNPQVRLPRSRHCERLTLDERSLICAPQTGSNFGWKILGHSSVAVMEAHYAHLLKEDLVATNRSRSSMT